MPRGNPIPTAIASDLLDRVRHLPAFLFGGTLLGAVRDGRFIRDDWDVDIAMLAEDWHESMLTSTTLTVETVRRWGPETPWALGTFVPEFWRGTPSMVKLVGGQYHVDLHVLAPGTDPDWRYWQRGPGDMLMRTPNALLGVSALAAIDGQPALVPVRAAELLTYCFGDWQKPLPASEWYASPEYQRIWDERAITVAA